MDALLKASNTKLQLLEIKQSKTQAVITSGNSETVKRHHDALKGLAREADECKIKIEQEKLSNDENLEDVAAWSSEVEIKLETIDTDIARIGKYLDEENQRAKLAAKEVDQVLVSKEREQQLQFERAQLEMKLEFDKKTNEMKNNQQGTSKTPCAKLPKLSITRFDGTFAQWLPFWNKFKAEIDSTDLPPVTKFAYLKELVEPKVRTDIDGLPFSAEGYEQAKSILTSEYGKESEIVHAYVNNIMGLPTISGSSPKKVDVQSLETLGRLRDVTGNVRAVLDKLKGIKADLVRGETGWQDWDFTKLLQAVKRWKEINPVEEVEDSKSGDSHRRQEGNFKPRMKSFQTQQQPRGCTYCDGLDHKTGECQKCVTVDDRRRILASKRLCFNCTRGNHRASNCPSRSGCFKCGKRHHTTICNNSKTGKAKLLTTQHSNNTMVIYPVVVVKVGGIMCRALLDTGAGSSYASAALLDRMGVKPCSSQVRRIEMMLGVQTRRVDLYSVNVANLKGDFNLQVEITRVDKPKLLELENPQYVKLFEPEGDRDE